MTTPLQRSAPEDVEEILKVCDLGIQFQQTVFHRHWFGFDRDLLVREIGEGRHWKIMEGPAIACVFSVQFDDTLVWGPQEPSIYLHRIVTDPHFKGRGYVPLIIEWARSYGAANGFRFIRLDTFPDNTKLMDYYVQCGFRFCGFRHFAPEEVVPAHYRDGLSLFEIALGAGHLGP